MGNKQSKKNRKNENLEDEKSMRIGIGFNKGSARVEGNLLVGCLHRRKYSQQPEIKNTKDDEKLKEEEENEKKLTHETSEPLLRAVAEETEENEEKKERKDGRR